VSINAESTLIQMQNNTNQVHYQNARKNIGSGKLDRDGFIRLILAQLQYQDPTEPKDNTEMLTQQLQLEQADQMKDLVSSNKFATAATMVGKQAELIDARWNFEQGVSAPPEWDIFTNSPKTVMGEIESVQFDRIHDKALVKINGNYYDADQIRQVFPGVTAVAPPPAQGGS